MFQKHMFNDTGKRWLRVPWNCELTDALPVGFLERGLGFQFGNFFRVKQRIRRQSRGWGVVI
jgi:hypothetical protein